jgi:hypothetical protein
MAQHPFPEIVVRPSVMRHGDHAVMRHGPTGAVMIRRYPGRKTLLIDPDQTEHPAVRTFFLLALKHRERRAIQLWNDDPDEVAAAFLFLSRVPGNG